MKTFVVGSHLYGLTNKNSDKDTLTLVLSESEILNSTDDNEIWTLDAFKEKLFAYDLKALEVYYEYMIDEDADYKLYKNKHGPNERFKELFPDLAKKESLTEFEIAYYTMINSLQYDGLIAHHSNGNHNMFELDLQKLRKSVSSVCSNSYVKAKKKINQGDVYIGLKSYYHVIRILTMYTYLAKHDTFKPRQFVNELEYVYQDLIVNQMKYSNDVKFDLIDDRYKTMIKSLQHTFRLYCPKNQ